MYTSNKEPVAAVIGNAGQRVYSDNMRQGVQRYGVDLRVSGTINVTVAGTSVINRGSILGAFNYIGLNDGGDDIVKIDARTLGFYSDIFSPSARSSTRLGGTGIATTPLVESLRLRFTLNSDNAAIPQETVHVQPDPTKRIRLFNELRADGGQGGILRGGTATMTVVPRFTAIDWYDDVTTKPPALVPAIRQELLTVPGANAAFRYDFSQADYQTLRAIIIQSDTDQGEVGDIINSLRINVGGRDVIGPAQVNWDDLLRGMEFDWGGSVYSTGVSYGQSSYLAIVFQENGRLSNTLSANLPNARFEFNWQPSAQAGVTVSQVRVTFLGLKKTPGITQAALPFIAG